jgi:hypothetical protein
MCDCQYKGYLQTNRRKGGGYFSKTEKATSWNNVVICARKTWSYTQLYREHACNSGTALWNLGEEGKEKRMIEWTISKYATFVQVDDVMICTESYWIIGHRRERVRESNIRDWTNQCTV